MRTLAFIWATTAGAAIALGPGASLSAQPAWKLVEQIRIGSVDDTTVALTDVRGVAVAADGRIFVFDYALQNIRMFAASGALVKTIGRKGAGPGEFRNANGMALAPDGRLWVNDPQNSRFAVFAPDGQFISHHTLPILGYGFIWEGHFDQRGRLYDPLVSSRRIRRVSGDGLVIDTLDARVCQPANPPREPVAFRARNKNGGSMFAQIPFMPSARSAWDPRGFVWCTTGDTYRLVQMGAEKGDTVHVIERRIDPVRVSRAERDSAIDRLKKQFANYAEVDADYSRIPQLKPAIVNMDVDDQNRLWVRRSVSDTRTTSFDVLDAQGQLVATVTAPFRVPPYWHVTIRGNDVYSLVLDDDDVQFVVHARLSRPGT
jgi:sugar lactone lactonase YvrE